MTDAVHAIPDFNALSDDERSEYEEFVEAIDLIGILQAKARAVLMRNAS